MKIKNKLVNLVGGAALAVGGLLNSADGGLVVVKTLDRIDTYSGSTALFANIEGGTEGYDMGLDNVFTDIDPLEIYSNVENLKLDINAKPIDTLGWTFNLGAKVDVPGVENYLRFEVTNSTNILGLVAYDTQVPGVTYPIATDGSFTEIAIANPFEGEYATWRLDINSIPEPLAIDFNDDGLLNKLDVNMLVDGISKNDYYDLLDLTNDMLVNNDDLNVWLTDAAIANGFSNSYLLGDSNLDGKVDSTDLNNLALNWRHDIALWSAGDFNADGYIDSADLNSIALNWRKSVPYVVSEAAAIPEPSALMSGVVGLAGLGYSLSQLRKKRN